MQIYGETGIGKKTVVKYLSHYLYERKIFTMIIHESFNSFLSNYIYHSNKKMCEDLINNKVLFVLENIDYLIKNKRS